MEGGAEERGNWWVGQALAMDGNKGCSEVHNHWTCSKTFSGKKGIKLSHGKFWPSHEKTFSKRAVNLKVEWVTAHGQGWKSHQPNYSKLNWTIKKRMVKANIPTGLGQRDTVSLFELFLCISRPNLHGKLPGTSNHENSGARLFQYGRLSHFTCLQGWICWMVTKLSILLLWQAWHLLVDSRKIKFLGGLKPRIVKFIENYGTVQWQQYYRGD